MFEFLQLLARGDVTPIGLLLLIIVCLITGRLVPYWQVEEMKQKLKSYEEKAPQLLVEVQKLIDLQQEENARERAKRILEEKEPPQVITWVIKDDKAE